MWQPDGTALVVAVWVLAILLLLGVAVGGHRFGARSLKHASARLIGSIVTTTVFVLAAVLTLNAQYGWYESWQDVDAAVTGKAPVIEQKTYGHARTQVDRDEAIRKAAADNAAQDAKYAPQRARFESTLHLRPSATGQWVKITVPGIRMRGKDIGRVMVWLPPSYTTATKRTYPVIEAFHGMPGGTLDYERVFHLDGALRTAQSAGSVRDAIIVVPQEMPGGVDTECVDGGGLDMETWLTSTVPDFVTQHLRAQASRESWVTLGVSAGGWCASMASVLHPDRYAGAAVLGGYFSPQFAAWKPFGSNVPQRYDLIEQVKQHPHPQAMWVLVSGADKISGASSQSFVEAATAYDITRVELPHAGHRISVWERTFPEVFSWLGKTFPTFASSASTSEAAGPAASGSSASGSPAGSVAASTPGAPAAGTTPTATHRGVQAPGVAQPSGVVQPQAPLQRRTRG